MIIPSNEIHLWLAYTDGRQPKTGSDACLTVLQEEERRRMRRFVFAKDRRLYLLARVLVRTVLSRYCRQIEPRAWRFAANEFGKPFLSPGQSPFSIEFNLSHSHDVVTLAVTRGIPVGVDVEHTGVRVPALQIADRFFSKREVEDLRDLAMEQRAQRFFTLWTLKESFIKAKGMGLSLALDSFGFVFPNKGPKRIVLELADPDEDASAWRFWQLRPTPDHLIALALNGATLSNPPRLVTREMLSLEQVSEVDCPLVLSS